MKTIVETGNDALIQVKGNQKFLLQECTRIADESTRRSESRTRSRGHGRKEIRTAAVFSAVHTLRAPVRRLWGQWIKSVVRCVRVRRIFDTKTRTERVARERAYYVCTKEKLHAREANRIIRSHWFIENNNHRVRDGTMQEDASRIRKNPDRFVVLRSFALNILRANGENNIGAASYENALSLEKILSYQGIM